MKTYEVVGSLAAIFFAVILFFSLASNPPIHAAWMRGAEDLTPPNFNLIGRMISTYIWNNLYAALMGFIVLAVALAVALAALLKRGESL